MEAPIAGPGKPRGLRLSRRMALLALAASLLPAVAGAAAWLLGLRAALPPDRIGMAAAGACLAAALAVALAAVAAGRRLERRLARTAAAPGRPQPAPAAALELDRLAAAIAAETEGGVGPGLRRFLLLARRRRPRRVRLEVNTAVQVCVEALRARGGAGGPQLRFDPDTNAGQVVLDPDAFHQILLNLIANASAAAGPDGRVEVRTQAMGEAVLVAVRDDGPGVPPGDLERIFRPFYTTRPNGLGLGLAVCRRLAETHGASISAVNILPHGLEVGLKLPLAGASPLPREVDAGRVSPPR